MTLSGDINNGGSVEVRIEGLGLNDGSVGVHIDSATQLASLVIDNAAFDSNSKYAVGTGSGGAGLGNISITNTTFTDNGLSSTNGSGSIVMFGFTGDAVIQNVDISNTSTDGTPQNDRADNAISFIGRDPVTYDVTDPAGDILIDNVTISGFYHKPPLSIQGYTDLSGFTFSNMTIEAGSNWGYVIFIDPSETSGDGVPGTPGKPGFFAGGAITSTLDLSDILVTNLSTVDVGYDVFVRGTDANDIQTGTNARDVLNALSEGDVDFGGDDVLFGLGGDDQLFGGVGDDALDGGDDDDMLDGGSGKDELFGGSGSDLLIGGSGNDVLDGGAGSDEMRGGTGSDTYYIDSAGDQIIELAGEGSDTLYTSVNYILAEDVSVENMRVNTTDGLVIVGNSSNNFITGNDGNDTLIGNDGNDRLNGKAGNDVLIGGDGNDTLFGDDGNDILDGGFGRDRITGGTGSDTFVFNDGDFPSAGRNNVDTITDFSQSELDKIDLQGVDAIEGGTDDDFTFVGQNAFSSSAGELRYEFFGSNTTFIMGDTDGDGVADFQIRFVGHIDFVEEDFSAGILVDAFASMPGEAIAFIDETQDLMGTAPTDTQDIEIESASGAARGLIYENDSIIMIERSGFEAKDYRAPDGSKIACHTNRAVWSAFGILRCSICAESYDFTGSKTIGMSYPQWDTFRSMCREAGLFCQKIDWPHVIQTWVIIATSRERLESALKDAAVQPLADADNITPWRFKIRNEGSEPRFYLEQADHD